MSEEGKEEEEKSNKFLSRKFLVWIVATIILIGAMGFRMWEVVNNFIPWWGSISVLYIGGNVAQDFAEIRKCG